MADGNGWWALCGALFVAGLVLGVCVAPHLENYLDRLEDARKRWLEWGEVEDATTGGQS